MRNSNLYTWIFVILLVTILPVGCMLNKPKYVQLATTPPQGIAEWPIQYSDSPKTVLFIFPHPDDEIVCAGTIAKMQQAGWSVNLLTLTQGAEFEKTVRKSEWTCTEAVLGYENMQIHDFHNNSWEAIVGDSMRFWNESGDTLKTVIRNHIQLIQPDIIVTYDDKIGGYGHPEHRITAELVLEIFFQDSLSRNTPRMQIFQITLPPDRELFNLSSVATYQQAKLLAGTNILLPPVTTFVDIESYWPIKRRAASCYTSQTTTLKKFYLLPASADTAMHYSTFNLEYYHEVKW